MAYYILKSYKLKAEPFEIFTSLSNQRHCFFLDSSLDTFSGVSVSPWDKPRSLERGQTRVNLNPAGRYSFLGIDPFYILDNSNQNPFLKLREILNSYKISIPKTNLPFLGGALGYLAYDLGFILEKKIKRKNFDNLGIPDCFFGFYNTAVIIDHFKKILYIFSAGYPEKTYHLSKSLCESNFKKIEKLLSQIKNPFSRKSGIPLVKDATGQTRIGYRSLVGVESNFSKEDYLSAIKKAKEYIKAGDIYQVNLSQRFQTQTDLSGLEIYQRLRRLSPSYFSAYLDAGDFQVLSSSPERFLKLEGDFVTTTPMKGTRGRGKNRTQDSSLKKELLKSAKDKAELIMIVDLERNDLGRVCNYDSIEVNTLRQIERYRTVFQTTATVSGRLHKDRDRIDLLTACFPGGSITGCPKIRAMEIIEELEPSRRSIYTGCLGYLSFCGNMDFNILIRTILKKENKLYFGVGGGIVADSRPENEYQETLVKAKGMLEAISP